MAVRIRLKRFGRRHRSFFRVSVMDQRSPRNGRVIEELGWYDPHQKDPARRLELEKERAAYWLSVGAQPSETVANLLKKEGVSAGKVEQAEPAAAPAVAGAPESQES